MSDLHGTKIVPGILIGDTHYIANEEFASFETYYWTSKEYFFGNRIDSYGLRHVFDIGWVQARGDTSGRPIVDFDVIIQVERITGLASLQFRFQDLKTKKHVLKPRARVQC